MNSVLRKVGSAVSPVALLVALLALVTSAAGVGYAAGQIGTGDIKNNAVTAKKIKKNAVTTKKIKKNAVNGTKVKDGSLGLADLPAQEAQKLLTLSNGGEGDCIWTGGAALPPPQDALNLGSPSYRKDLLGTVHLAGLASATDGPGGDAVCGGELNDQLVTTLPAGYVPAKTILLDVSGNQLLIVGAAGLIAPGPIALPAGTVVVDPTAGPLVLDGISFLPGGSPLAAKQAAPRGQGQLSADTLELLRGR